MTSIFNLTTEVWINCIGLDGAAHCLGLREVLLRAHELRGLSDNNPLTVAALHRLLLAIIHRAVAGPKNYDEWENLWKRGNFADTKIAAYLDAQVHHFDLFSETDPFYQTSGFTLDSGAAVGHKLFHELATANNKTLFDHSLDTEPSLLTPAQAARALITAQMYSLGGGQGGTSNLGKHPYLGHAPLIMGAVIMVQGKTLFETLMLNLLIYDQDEEPIVSNGDDAPVWECTPEKWENLKEEAFGETILNGYLNYLTWRSRHIRLLPEQVDGTTIVRQVYIAQAYMLHKDFHAKERGEPMFAYRQGDTDNDPKPLKLNANKALWRDSATLFEFSQNFDGRAKAFRRAKRFQAYRILPQGPLRATVIGLANDKANPLAWRMETFSVPQEILSDEELVQTLKDALRWAEEICTGKDIPVPGTTKKSRFPGLHGCTRRLAAFLLKPQDSRKADADMVTKLSLSLGTEARYWAELETPFRELLAHLDDTSRLPGWYETVVDTAENALQDAANNYAADSARGFQARAQALACFRQAYALLKEKIGDEQEETADEQ